ncbi:MAG: hypothetical protein C0613_15465 [Desulfobulbaceae bacterium]|nr:MAG: hypothetical protein C0613_15465 [Desulfobulbaceae bacterium]
MAGQPIDIDHKCAKCGACAAVCPVYQSTGRESHTARGKLHLFANNTSFSSAYFNDLLAKCLQCGACDDICPRHLQPAALIRAWRQRQPFAEDPHGLIKLCSRKVLASPRLQESGAWSLRRLAAGLPATSGLRKRLDLIIPDLIGRSELPMARPPADAASLAYFPGCLAGHLYKEIQAATALLAGRCGYRLTTPKEHTCCGLACHAGGSSAEARRLAEKNIKAFAQSSGPILTSCASCTSHLMDYPSLFSHEPDMLRQARAFAERIVEFSTFFVEQQGLHGLQRQEAVFYHHPCHLRFGPCRVSSAPGRLLSHINGCAPLSLPPHCCGQGGLFHLTNPEISRDIFNRALQPLLELSAETVVTTCSGCLLQWQQGTARAQGLPIAEHLAVFLAKASRD